MVAPVVKFRSIDHGSPEYADGSALRHRVLRVPLGLSIYDEDLDAEQSDLHFGMFDGATLIACVVLTHCGDECIRVRQMAVDTPFQRQGLGRELMEQVEADVRKRNLKTIILHSRKTVVAFYQNLGYELTDKEFIEVTIPHVLMEKHV